MRVAPHLSVVMRQALPAAGWCLLADARAASSPPTLEAQTWYSIAEKCWYIIAESYWYIVGRKMTL